MKDTIICSRCGAENPKNSKYCRGCGYELPKAAVVENVVATKSVNSPKKVSLGLTIGLIIGGLFIGAIIGFIIGIIGTFIYLNDFSQPKLTNTGKNLVEMAAGIANNNLSVMIDSETRLDNMKATDEKTYQYTYTLVNMEKDKVDTTAMKQRMEPNIINSVKTTPAMEFQRKNKMTLVYYYKDKNGDYLFSIVVTPDKYK